MPPADPVEMPRKSSSNEALVNSSRASWSEFAITTCSPTATMTRSSSGTVLSPSACTYSGRTYRIEFPIGTSRSSPNSTDEPR